MDIENVKKHAYTLLMSFLGAVCTAAGIAALQWFGAHIPDALAFVSTVGGAAAAQKMNGN